jgi:hypothetical protein
MNGERTVDAILACTNITPKNQSPLCLLSKLVPKRDKSIKSTHIFYTRDEAEMNDLYTTYIVLSLKCLKMYHIPKTGNFYWKLRFLGNGDAGILLYPNYDLFNINHLIDFTELFI